MNRQVPIIPPIPIEVKPAPILNGGRRWSYEEDEMVLIAAGDEDAIWGLAQKIGCPHWTVRKRMNIARLRTGQDPFTLPACISREELEKVVRMIMAEDDVDRPDAVFETRRLAVEYMKAGAYDWPEHAPPLPIPPPPAY